MVDRFTGCSCGSCDDAAKAAIKAVTEMLKRNDNCPVWAAMVCNGMVHAANAALGSVAADAPGGSDALASRAINGIEREMLLAIDRNRTAMRVLFKEGLGVDVTGEVTRIDDRGNVVPKDN